MSFWSFLDEPAGGEPGWSTSKETKQDRDNRIKYDLYRAAHKVPHYLSSAAEYGSFFYPQARYAQKPLKLLSGYTDEYFRDRAIRKSINRVRPIYSARNMPLRMSSRRSYRSYRPRGSYRRTRYRNPYSRYSRPRPFRLSSVRRSFYRR